MTTIKNSKGEMICTNVPENVLNVFLTRVDHAYHEADTLRVTTDVSTNHVRQEIVKLNSVEHYEYTLN